MVLLLEQQNFNWAIRYVTTAAFGSYGIRKYEIKTALRSYRFAHNTAAVFVVMCCDSQQFYWNNLQQNEVNWLQVSTERKALQHVIWIEICCDDDVNKRSNPQLLQNFTSCKSVKST